MGTGFPIRTGQSTSQSSSGADFRRPPEAGALGLPYSSRPVSGAPPAGPAVPAAPGCCPVMAAPGGGSSADLRPQPARASAAASAPRAATLATLACRLERDLTRPPTFDPTIADHPSEARAWRYLGIPITA